MFRLRGKQASLFAGLVHTFTSGELRRRQVDTITVTSLTATYLAANAMAIAELESCGPLSRLPQSLPPPASN